MQQQPELPPHTSKPRRVFARRQILYGALVGLTLAACGSGAQAPVSAADLSTYTLGPGDRIKLTVFGEPDLSGEFEIDGTGKAALPLIGNVQLGGLNLRDAEGQVTNALKPKYLLDPRVNIEVLNYRPFYILGEVKNPGSFPYVNGMTVLNAVALAGGFTYRARESSMTITRASDPSHTEEEANPDTPILPGDIVRVPERFF